VSNSFDHLLSHYFRLSFQQAHTCTIFVLTGLFPELLHGWIPEKIIAGDKWTGVLQWYWPTVPKLMVRDRVSGVMVSDVRFRLGLVDLWNCGPSE